MLLSACSVPAGSAVGLGASPAGLATTSTGATGVHHLQHGFRLWLSHGQPPVLLYLRPVVGVLAPFEGFPLLGARCGSGCTAFRLGNLVEPRSYADCGPVCTNGFGGERGGLYFVNVVWVGRYGQFPVSGVADFLSYMSARWLGRVLCRAMAWSQRSPAGVHRTVVGLWVPMVRCLSLRPCLFSYKEGPGTSTEIGRSRLTEAGKDFYGPAPESQMDSWFCCPRPGIRWRRGSVTWSF